MKDKKYVFVRVKRLQRSKRRAARNRIRIRHDVRRELVERRCAGRLGGVERRPASLSVPLKPSSITSRAAKAACGTCASGLSGKPGYKEGFVLMPGPATCDVVGGKSESSPVWSTW